MAKVRNILEAKGRVVYSVEPTVMVLRAIELMCEKNIGGLLITENGKLAGIFTERDYARKLILKGKSSKDTPIGELMTPNPFTVSPETSIDECMQLMTDKHIRHLPVTEGDQLVGMISIGDVVRQVIQEQKSIIEHLESYITQ
ncbi:MAG: CBS domain-containing protein [Cyclobacteriaceae bacterium]|jgi:CBS domain-containing protein